MASTPTPPTEAVSHEEYFEENPLQEELLGAAASTDGGDDEDEGFNARANRVRQRAMETLEGQETTRLLLLQRADATIEELKRLVAIDVILGEREGVARYYIVG